MQASSLAREAQTSGFAVRMPQWISRLCMPHWSIALTLLSTLNLGDAGGAAEGEQPLPDLVAALSRILHIFAEFFRAAGTEEASDAFGDDAADAVLSYVLNSDPGTATASAAPPAPGCTSPLSNVQTMLPPSMALASAAARSAPVLPDPLAKPPPAVPAATAVGAATEPMLLFVSLEELPAAESSAFEGAEFIMSDVVDVGRQEGFGGEQGPECYRCILEAPLFQIEQQPSDTVSLIGSAALSEPPPPASAIVPGAGVPALQHPRPPPIALPSPTFTPPASQLLMPSQAPSLALCLPKPTVESFGLEQDEATAISFGPTPIPSLLAFCRGPSRHASPGLDTTDGGMHVESSTDDSSFRDDSSTEPPSPQPGAGMGELGGGAGGSGLSTGRPQSAPPTTSPFGGTALLVGNSAGDCASAVGVVPPASPSPPPQCRSPEPPVMRSPADDVGIPFSTLFAPSRARSPPQPCDDSGSAPAEPPLGVFGAAAAAAASLPGAGLACDSCCNIFGSGGTASLVPQEPPPRPPEPFCSPSATACSPWGHSEPHVVMAHSSWHTPAYERGSVMLCDSSSAGEGSGALCDESAPCADPGCAGGPCSVSIVCSHMHGPGATAAASRDRHRRTASMPAEFAVSSRQLSMAPVGRAHAAAAGEGPAACASDVHRGGGLFGGYVGDDEEVMPRGLMPRAEGTLGGGGLWGRDGPSGMASRRARSICLDNLNL